MKRLQNRIAENRYALPVTAVYGMLVCLAAGFIEHQMWVQSVCLVVSTLLMAELNNSNSLIRIYSRMVSCSYLVLTVMASFLLPSMPGAIVGLCFIAFYLSLFNAYQDRQAAGWVFYAFFAIGMASTVFVQVLFFVPVLWILLAVNILAFSARTFFASLLGLIMPYWFIGAYYVFTDDFEPFIQHFLSIAKFARLFDYSLVGEHLIVTFAFMVLISIVGIVHFLRHSYNDKIRTRMLYEIFITINICCMVFIVLQPQHYDCVLHIMIVNTAPLIGHFIALTRTRLTNIFFITLMIVVLLITAYNLWISSLIF